MNETLMLILVAAVSVLIVAILRAKWGLSGLSHSVIVTIMCIVGALITVLSQSTLTPLHLLVDGLLIFGPIDLFSKGLAAILHKPVI